MSMIIYGVGKLGRQYVDKCLSCGMERDNIKLVDSNKELWGKWYQNIEIQNPEEVFKEQCDVVVISAGDKYRKEIAEYVINYYHVPEEKIAYHTQTVIIPKSRTFDIGSIMLVDIGKSAFGKKQHYSMWNELYKTALDGMNIGSGGNLERSGEMNVLMQLKAAGKNNMVLFDVGANVGEYTKCLVSLFPNAKIHSFEPAKGTFDTLSKNVAGSNVTLNNIGISNEIVRGTLYADKENSGLASLYNRQLDYLGLELGKKEEVELTTLDYYCEKNNIDVIDFLKMDIEGNEYKALLGAEHLLNEKKIGAIQIEVGGANIDSRTYFRDFWNLLHEDFSVYRILQDGLWEIQKYEEILENFITVNYLFIKK